MPLNTLPSDPLPDQPISRSPAYAVDETQFGDGYNLRAELGINSETWTVRLNWSNINPDEHTIIKNFLQAHAPTTPFYYTAQGDQQRPYVCTDWSEREHDGEFWDVTATLVEYHAA